MNKHEPPQVSRLRLDHAVELAMEILSPSEYEEALNWIRERFTFVRGQQQIDWSHDPDAVSGEIATLTEERLRQVLNVYGVEASRRITIVWAYGDMGMILPLDIAAKHVKDMWLPVLDDVFLFDPQDIWCMELQHEGEFSCGRYLVSQTG